MRDHVGGEQARASGDGERLALDEAEKVEAVQRRQPVHRQRRRLLERGALRDGNHGRRGDDHKRRLRAALRSSRGQCGHRLVADREVLHSGADRLDGAGGVHAGNPGCGLSLDTELSYGDVRRVHSGSPDGEPDLARPDFPDLALDHAQDLRPTRSRDPHRSRRRHHGVTPYVLRPCRAWERYLAIN